MHDFASQSALLPGILDSAAEAILAVNEAQRIVLFNKAAERIFGYRAEEALGQPLDMLLPPHFVEAHHRHLRGYAAAPEAAHRLDARPELAARRKDGTEFPVQIGISKLNQDGQTIYTAVLLDITERRQAEAALAAERNLLRTLIDNLPDTVYAKDTCGRFIFKNLTDV